MYVAAIGRSCFWALYLLFFYVCDEGLEWRKMKLIVIIKRWYV